MINTEQFLIDVDLCFCRTQDRRLQINKTFVVSYCLSPKKENQNRIKFKNKFGIKCGRCDNLFYTTTHAKKSLDWGKLLGERGLIK